MRSISIIHVCVVLVFCILFFVSVVQHCHIQSGTARIVTIYHARLNENATINAEIFRACQKGAFCQKNNAIPHTTHTHNYAHTHTPWYNAHLSYETRTHVHTHTHKHTQKGRATGRVGVILMFADKSKA